MLLNSSVAASNDRGVYQTWQIVIKASYKDMELKIRLDHFLDVSLHSLKRLQTSKTLAVRLSMYQ